jgi:hypothetical protein
MTKTVFSMPMERLGAMDADKNRSTERGRVIAGPQRRPVIGPITHVPNVAARRAILGTVPEKREEAREQQQTPEKISMDSHLIFSHGRLMM